MNAVAIVVVAAAAVGAEDVAVADDYCLNAAAVVVAAADVAVVNADDVKPIDARVSNVNGCVSAAIMRFVWD